MNPANLEAFIEEQSCDRQKVHFPLLGFRFWSLPSCKPLADLRTSHE